MNPPRKTVEAILLDLIAIPSVSAMNNQPVIDYVTHFLDPQHWSFELCTSEDAAGKAKTNLVALTNNALFTNNAVNRSADLAFVCHTDTVPFLADWPEAVHPAVRDGRIYGRGSCDVKGFLACALAVLDQIDFAHLEKPLALVLTADEEVGCIGAKKLASMKAFSARQMVIGEPTGLRPVRAGKGYSLGSIVVRGREAHSAFPGEGRSAIFDAARVLLCLEQLAEDLKRRSRPAFNPPFTTLNVGLIEGGTAKNIIPGECHLTVEWRPVPADSIHQADDVPALIEQILSTLAAATPGLNAAFEVKRADPPFAPSATRDLADRLSALTGNAPTTIAFGSEAAHLGPLAHETVVFGPGDMTVAHRTGEFVAIADLHQCVSVLSQLIVCRAA